MKSTRKHNQQTNQEGFFLVMSAFLIAVIISLVALAIGTGMIATGETRLQNTANLVALAGLEQYELNGISAGYSTRANQALARANYILKQNKLPGSITGFGDITHANASPEGDGGSMEIGIWYPTPPTGTDPCTGNYPCFVANNSPPVSDQSSAANAVSVTIRNKANPIIVGLAAMFGRDKSYLTSKATASLVQRCTAYLLDNSLSSSFETHNSRIDQVTQNGPGVEPQYSITQPSYASLPLYRDYAAYNVKCFDPTDSQRFSPETIFWCNMAAQRPDPAVVPVDPRVHYRSDYSLRSTNYANGMKLYIDTFMGGDYSGPEPFTSYTHGINAGLRLVDSVGSPGDKAFINSFAGQTIARVPAVSMNSNLSLLIQVTNVLNRGMTDYLGAPLTEHPEAHPNMMDYNIFPMLITDDKTFSSTNIIQALDRAVYDLRRDCPDENSQRLIVLATDGVGNCRRNSNSIGGLPQNPYDPNWGYTCDDTYNSYEAAVAQLANQDWADSLLNQMLRSNIGITTLMSGSYIKPNTLNIRSEDGTHFIDFQEARRLGYTGKVVSNAAPSGIGLKPFGEFTSTDPSAPTPDKNAYQNLGKDGYRFGDPTGILMELSLATGGFFCPILPLCDDKPCNAGKYKTDPEHLTGPCKLDDAFRVEGAPQNCSIYQLNKGEQAAACVQQSLNASPYVLVDRPSGS